MTKRWRVLDNTEITAWGAAHVQILDGACDTVLVVVPDERADEFADLAALLAVPGSPTRLVLARLLPRSTEAGGELDEFATATRTARRLAGRPYGADVRGTPAVRFAADPAAGRAALAATLRADVVVAAPDTGPGALPGHATGVAVRLGRDPLPAGPVTVLVDGTPAGRTAARLGAVLATRARRAVTLDATDGLRAVRQAAATAEVLTRLGVEIVRNAAPSGVVVAPAGAGPSDDATTLLSVRPDDTDRDHELDQVLDRAGLGAAPALCAALVRS